MISDRRNFVTVFMLALVASTMFLLVGCGTTGPAKPLARTPANLPVWPKPPSPARIRYLRSIRGPNDWGIHKSLFRHLIDALLGKGRECFVLPMGVAEYNRVLYVADPGAQALWILDGQRHQVEELHRFGQQYLISPVAVAVRPDGDVYLADSALRKIFLVDRDGKLIDTIAGHNMKRPTGLAYDATRQRLYVSDSAGQDILVFGPNNEVIHRWGQVGSANGEFHYPTHLALDTSGNLLVTDALNFRVQAFSSDGKFLWKFGQHGDQPGYIAMPKGVASDREGHVFLVDTLFDALQIFDRHGRFLLGIGGQGVSPGKFWLPGGIFINPQDEIFVADSYNRRIQVFSEIPQPAAKGAHSEHGN